MADAAANRDRGSVPSSMELRGSGGAEEEEEEDEEVLPLRSPRRVLVSVTCVERRGLGQSRKKTVLVSVEAEEMERRGGGL